MTMLNFFYNRQILDWKIIDKETKDIIDEWENFYKLFFDKIDAIQGIILSIKKFEYDKFTDEKDIKRRSTGHANNPSHNLFKRYRKSTYRAISNMLEKTQQQQKIIDLEEHEEKLMHRKILVLDSVDEQMRKEDLFLEQFREKLEKLRGSLEKEKNLLEYMQKTFTVFVGEEKYWKLAAEALNTNEEQIIKDWKAFTDNLEELRKLFSSTLSTATGEYFPQGVSNWAEILRGAVREVQIFKELSKFQQLTHTMKELQHEKKIKIFHANSDYSQSPLPLNEKKGAYGGFYFCTGSEKHAYQAVKFKAENPRTVVLEMPASLFEKLSKEDPHHGQDGDEQSKNAYKKAHFIPVGNYPEFNRYFFYGIIRRV